MIIRHAAAGAAFAWLGVTETWPRPRNVRPQTAGLDQAHGGGYYHPAGTCPVLTRIRGAGPPSRKWPWPATVMSRRPCGRHVTRSTAGWQRRRHHGDALGERHHVQLGLREALAGLVARTAAART